MESHDEAGGPTAAGRSDIVGPALGKPWVKIAVLVLVIVVIIAALALLARHANRAPTIRQASATPSSTTVQTLIKFSAQAADPDGDDLTYGWDFGDGTTTTGSDLEHAYSMPGKYLALLTVTDGKGGEVTNDGNLLNVSISPSSSELNPRMPCNSATCAPGRVVAVLAANRSTGPPGATVLFNGNNSWADSFSWTNASNHTQGGTYSSTPMNASGNTSLFALFRYAWGDGTANLTGTSDLVGHTAHRFDGSGNYFVRLTVTYVNAELYPPTKSASAGFTVRVAPSVTSLSNPSMQPGLRTFEGTGLLSRPYSRVNRID